MPFITSFPKALPNTPHPPLFVFSFNAACAVDNPLIEYLFSAEIPIAPLSVKARPALVCINASGANTTN